MIRIIILAQMAIYLLIAPNILHSINTEFRPFNLITFLAISAFSVGAYAYRRKAISWSGSTIYLRQSALMGYAMLGFLYIYISLDYGLSNRRLGSEYMAQLYANMPLTFLIPLRVYEILQIPIIYLFVRNIGRYGVVTSVVFVVSLIATFPFAGIIDSRGKIFVLIIAVSAMFSPRDLMAIASRSIAFIGLVGIAIITFVAASAVRMASYGRSEDYYYNDVFRRLDGYNLVREIIDYKLVGFFGSLDFNIFGVFISRLPFLDAAREMKMLGLTSSKQYILQEVLKTKRFDEVSSMMTDIYYFGGTFFVALSFFMLGVLCRIFDSSVADSSITRSRLTLAAGLSFAISFSIFESDFFGNIVQFFLFLGMFTGILWVSAVVQRSDQPDALRAPPRS